MTMMHAKAWKMRGSCQERLLLMLLVPKVMAAAGMDPPNQPQL
jgi:hypothetical protein